MCTHNMRISVLLQPHMSTVIGRDANPHLYTRVIGGYMMCGPQAALTLNDSSGCRPCAGEGARELPDPIGVVLWYKCVLAHTCGCW